MKSLTPSWNTIIVSNKWQEKELEMEYGGFGDYLNMQNYVNNAVVFV
jgi:hypothetical protein